MTRLATFCFWFSLALSTSCATGSDGTPSGADSAGSGGTGATTSGAAGAGTSGGTGGTGTGTGATGGMGGTGGSLGLPGPDCAPPVDLGVRIVGRHDGCEEGGIRMAWSGTGFVARFDGTGLTFTQSGNPVHYTVVVDGEVVDELVTGSGEQTYEAVSGLEPGEHTVEVYRQGEASFGATTLAFVEVIDGMLLEPPARPERRIEIFGDSISCGYGNEGESASCSFSAETENHYLSYGAILAREFEAELSTVAWSGKGVVVNYGGGMSTTLPEMAGRAVPGSVASVWDYSLVPAPDLVLINLGTNDFSTDNDPSPEDFVAGYADLLYGIRARYPDAFILCTVGPLLSGSDLTKARIGISDAVAQVNEAGDDAVVAFEIGSNNPSPGCDWHPSIATHEAMADELSTPIAEHLGW